MEPCMLASRGREPRAPRTRPVKKTLLARVAARTPVRALILLLHGAAVLGVGSGCTSSDPAVADGNGQVSDQGRTPDKLPADRGSANDLGAVDRTVPGPDLAPAIDATVKPDIYTQSLPNLGSLSLFVNLGDSIAEGFGLSSKEAYADLLMSNNDWLYPAYKGQDLSTLYPGIKVADLSSSGASSTDLPSQYIQAPANTSGTTLVVISIGGNDLLYSYVGLLDAKKVQDLAKTVQTNLGKAFSHFSNKTKYPGGATFLIFNVYDFTDGMGTIPSYAQVDQYCAYAKSLGPFLGPLLLSNLALYNKSMAQFAQTSKVYLVDIYAGFLGHGFNYNNPKALYYDPTDLTLWFQTDCIHPNAAGHEAIRRLVWRILTGK